MALQVKKLSFRPKTACLLVNSSDSNLDRYKLVALPLLHGNYNPSRNGTRCVYGYWILRTENYNK